jgi:hypothetical protein
MRNTGVSGRSASLVGLTPAAKSVGRGSYLSLRMAESMQLTTTGIRDRKLRGTL